MEQFANGASNKAGGNNQLNIAALGRGSRKRAQRRDECRLDIRGKRIEHDRVLREDIFDKLSRV